MRIFSDKLYQNNEPYGYIELVCKLVEYRIDVYLFGVSVPVETVKTDNYNYAINRYTAIMNKYNNK